MKVNFAICDDSVVDSNYVKELVTQWAIDKKYQVNIDIFSSAEAFIFHYVENKEIRDFTAKMKHSLEVTGRMIKKNGGKVYTSLDDVVEFINNFRN